MGTSVLDQYGSPEDHQEPSSHGCQLLSDLPKQEGWRVGPLYNYQGFWCLSHVAQSVPLFQHHFKPQPTDVILASVPKSGTIWLKALIFAITNRSHYNPRCSSSHDHHPLLSTPPHQLVPFLEGMVYGNNNRIQDHYLTNNQDQIRLFATHVPYASLPKPIKDIECKIVYLCRNPRDNFVSLWQFMDKWAASTTSNKNLLVGDRLCLEEAFGFFCKGVSLFGPFWDHVLGYWKESLVRPQKVLFLKYEDLHKDGKAVLEKLAEFLGCGFSVEEESEGVIEEIMRLCSFDHLRSLEVNKNTLTMLNFERKILFRRGEVGDWKNYLTPLLVEQLDRVVEEKLGGSGLIFEYSID